MPLLLQMRNKYNPISKISDINLISEISDINLISKISDINLISEIDREMRNQVN